MSLLFNMLSRLVITKLEQTLGDGEGQRSLACCSPWGHKVKQHLATGQQYFPLDRKLWCTDTEEVETINREHACWKGKPASFLLGHTGDCFCFPSGGWSPVLSPSQGLRRAVMQTTPGLAPRSPTGLSMVYSPWMLNMVGVCWRCGCRKNEHPGLVIVIVKETLPKSLALPVREMNMCCVHLPWSGGHMFKHLELITLIQAKHTFEKMMLLK